MRNVHRINPSLSIELKEAVKNLTPRERVCPAVCAEYGAVESLVSIREPLGTLIVEVCQGQVSKIGVGRSCWVQPFVAEIN